MALNLHNSLSKKVEKFNPIHADHVGMYTCGPTVYDYVHIGNWRTYILSDVVARVLAYNGYTVSYYMNITDVGHLTGDNAGDADTGEDRMEKAKRREGKNAWEIALFYTADFVDGWNKLNLKKPTAWMKATSYIPEQIELVEKLFSNGLAYQISDGIYFDTVLYEEKGYVYGELSNLDSIKAGARVEYNPEKRNPRDFALWKFSPVNEKRDMEWQSPWGVGFPGWHIECSAMSMKYLGEQFDIHVGGEDLKSTHHPNEIAQAQGATGKHPFVAYWMHGAFLQVDGGRMGKSLGNAFNLHDIEKRGINPLSLRYFYFTAHYNSHLNFTWESLTAAENALKNLYSYIHDLGDEIGNINIEYKNKFTECINNDLNLPQALSHMWELLKDKDISNADKKATLFDFDTVFGFGLDTIVEEEIPLEISKLSNERDIARENKNWARADELRLEIESQGYKVKDSENGTLVTKF
ncbi:MAG: cysteine--tRNA ligase [bacterium]